MSLKTGHAYDLCSCGFNFDVFFPLKVPVQLLDLMHTLHTRAAQIYQWWASESGETSEEEKTNNVPVGPSLWCRGWCPLLQGIARLCCDSRKQVRTTAITYLQRSLLVHDLQSLSACEWESCFNTVLFPLLAKLLEPQRSEGVSRAQMQADHSSWEETRIRAATLLSKVFLQHLGPLLQLPTFTALWLTLLDFMDKYMHVEHNDLLAEAVPEMMKNLLLVMETAGVFGSSDGGVETTPSATTESPHMLHMKTQLWNMTCDRIDVFLPGLRQEITRSKTPVARVPASVPTDLAMAEVDVPESVPDSQHNSLESAPEQIVLELQPTVPESPSECLVIETEQQEPVSLPAVVEMSQPAETQALAPQLTAVSTEKSSVNFVPSSVFSVWNVPDPSDAAALFFHDLAPAPTDDMPLINQVSNQENQDRDSHQLPILPISLIQEDGSALPVVPLPVFTTLARDDTIDITQPINKV